MCACEPTVNISSTPPLPSLISLCLLGIPYRVPPKAPLLLDLRWLPRGSLRLHADIAARLPEELAFCLADCEDRDFLRHIRHCELAEEYSDLRVSVRMYVTANKRTKISCVNHQRAITRTLCRNSLGGVPSAEDRRRRREMMKEMAGSFFRSRLLVLPLRRAGVALLHKVHCVFGAVLETRAVSAPAALLRDCVDCATAFNMESSNGTVGISTAAVVAIVCNVLVAVLILVLFLILYKACKVPSSQERVPVLAPGNTQQKNEQKYLLTT
ncbi:hypothetical protein NFI96_000628 [Prochilodus magdalenae]|nr:hypothetical protein NFI96_000628 [Prochilodus magdalenae]